MATYSIDLIEEYKALEKINDLRNYFRRFKTNPSFKYEGIEEILDDLTSRLKLHILSAVRVWASVMLQHPDSKFEL